MSDWYQALPDELADFLEIPRPGAPDAVLTRVHRDVRKVGEAHRLYVKGFSVGGMDSYSPDVIVETTDRLLREAVPNPTILWVVYECFNNQAAEYWRAVINHNGNNRAMRKGHFVFAEFNMVRGEPPAQYLGGALYNRAVNRAAEHVPDGRVTFPDRDTAMQFLRKAVELASVSRASHALAPEEYQKAMHLSGFDLSGFTRIGAALNDPFFLTETDNIRKRLRSLFKRNALSHLNMSGLTGNKTAADIRDIYHALVKDYERDIPRYFPILKDAVLTVAGDYPKIDAHNQLSVKTWHNNVSGVLGGSSNVTNNHLTAKWTIILSVIAAHNRNLSPAHAPAHASVTPEQLFFWVVYGSPTHLVKAVGQSGVALTTSVIPAYPRIAFDDLSLRKPIIHILDRFPPHAGDDWEENFLRRIR